MCEIASEDEAELTIRLFERKGEGHRMDRVQNPAAVLERIVKIKTGFVSLEGCLVVPESARGVIVFVHGSGSSRHSPRNRLVASQLNEAGFATLLVDLLTAEEESVDLWSRHLRFDIPLLSQRVTSIAGWLDKYSPTRSLPLGLFGASTGAAAALIAAISLPQRIAAVVSRGGRIDLAEGVLPRLQAPLLCLVGANDSQVMELNNEALAQVRCEKKLEKVEGAGHLFEEPGALESVAEFAKDWFLRFCNQPSSGSRPSTPWTERIRHDEARYQ